MPSPAASGEGSENLFPGNLTVLADLLWRATQPRSGHARAFGRIPVTGIALWICSWIIFLVENHIGTRLRTKCEAILLQLSEAELNRLVYRAARSGEEAADVCDLLARMLVIGPKLDADPNYQSEEFEGGGIMAIAAGAAAIAGLKIVAAAHNLSFMEAALYLRNEWVGAKSLWADFFRGRGGHACAKLSAYLFCVTFRSVRAMSSDRFYNCLSGFNPDIETGADAHFCSSLDFLSDRCVKRSSGRPMSEMPRKPPQPWKRFL